MVWFGLMSILGGACEPACGQSTHGRHQRRPGRSDPQPRQLLTPTTRHSPGQRHREPGGRLVCLYVRPPARPAPTLSGRSMATTAGQELQRGNPEPAPPCTHLDPRSWTPDPRPSHLPSPLRAPVSTAACPPRPAGRSAGGKAAPRALDAPNADSADGERLVRMGGEQRCERDETG